MAFTLITITATFTRPDGQPAEGKVTATLSQQLRNGTTVLEPEPIVGVLNASGQLKDRTGELPFSLEANDDAGTLPAGSTYEFVPEIDSANLDPFTAVVPHTAPAGTIDITALM
jgi:hypothetical protein